MAEKKKEKKRISIYSILGKIGDILLIPIMIVALISSISMIANRSQNKPTSFLGNYLVTIQSPSMKNDGFLVGDTVLTRKTKGIDLKLGDVIAFYNYRDYSDPSISQLELVIKYTNTSGTNMDTSDANITVGTIDLNSIEYKEVEHSKTVEDAQESNTKINFHKIVGIYVDETNGTFYFRTKGSNNNGEDTITIRQDFVVGKYINTPRTVRDVIKFCASALGMILLVCIPLSLQVLLQCLSLIEQFGIMSNEKALITGKASFKDPEFKKDFDGNVMELYNKVYFYYLVPKEDKELAKEFMWSNILYSEKLSRKETKLLNTVNSASEKLETNDDAYWHEWLDNTKGYDHRKINKHYENLITDKIIKESKIASASSTSNSLASTNNKSDKKNEMAESVVEEKSKEAKKPRVSKNAEGVKKATAKSTSEVKKSAPKKPPTKPKKQN